jgi:hypothetical protein
MTYKCKTWTEKMNATTEPKIEKTKKLLPTSLKEPRCPSQH